MSLALAALLIFALRVTDVSIGTLRVLYAVRGRRLVAAGLGFFESAVFIFAISSAMRDIHPAKMIAYACGFAAGNYVGITIERWIASGTILARVVTRTGQTPALLAALRDRGFGVTTIHGSGQHGDVELFFVVAPRKRERELLHLIEEIDPHAFVTLDAVHRALGGYLTTAIPRAVTVRK
jgi:uncharacterized protein YebE (UPF0316 family)